jgi:hypothetical protein
MTSDSEARLHRHFRPCAAIPVTVPPFQALQRHRRHCRSPGQRDTTTPAAVQPPVFRQPNPRAGVRTVTEREAPTLLPSKPLLDKHRTRHDAHQKRDSPGQPSTPRHCASCRHMYHIESCVMTVNRLPLAYKRRRRSPGRGGTTDSGSLAQFCLRPRYWHFVSSKP